MVLLIAAIASLLGWLPDWVAFSALVVAMVNNVVTGRIPALMRIGRELRAGMPRIDPDFSPRR
jgi:HAMP domain-containing protein